MKERRKYSIYIAEMTAIEIALKKSKQELDNDCESSIKAMESGKFQNPIINKIYDLAAELLKQE